MLEEKLPSLLAFGIACALGCGSNDPLGPGDAGSDAGSSDAPASQDSAGSDTSTEGSAPVGPTVGGCPVFASDYAYNQDISQTPLDPGSTTYIANLVARAGTIDAPVGTSEYVNVVPASQAGVSVGVSGGASWGFDATDTFFSSNASTFQVPVPSGVQYENSGTPNADHHMIIVQQGACRLFELYSWNPSSATSGWSAVVTWNLTKSDVLPDGWGSTTAAGTPLLPGVIWSAEIVAGKIEHAVDIVIPGAAIAKYEYVKPAARSGGACGSNYPLDGFPYGGRVRLKASFDDSSFTGNQAKVVVAALKKYGMINTDDSGESRSSFRLGDGSKLDQTDMAQLSNLTWDDFEVPAMTVVTSKACN